MTLWHGSDYKHGKATQQAAFPFANAWALFEENMP